jgi:hypothetical protein
VIKSAPPDKPTKNGKKTDSETRFKPGNPGGPGRPSGSRNTATLVLDKLADGDAKAILQQQLDKAKAGDARAAELILSRVWPPRKGRPVAMKLPAIETAADLVKALGAVADAVAAGDLTPDEGAGVAAVLETKRRAVETVELETRIAALEQERKQ